jgi:hypothetical protein
MQTASTEHMIHGAKSAEGGKKCKISASIWQPRTQHNELSGCFHTIRDFELYPSQYLVLEFTI